MKEQPMIRNILKFKPLKYHITANNTFFIKGKLDILKQFFSKNYP